MRDLLPAEAEAQGKLAASVLGTFDLYGYQRVSVPAFEYADVLEKGLGTVELASVLRFVEPESGEVVALRPDMTPQIARMVATRLGDLPAPARLSYRGSVLRRQHERARHNQQSLQAGIELVGEGGTACDLEVIRVCSTAVRRAGLKSFVLDLGHGGIATSLLQEIAKDAHADILESLSLKDGAQLARRAKSAGLSEQGQKALVGLLTLQGGADVFVQAKALLFATPAWPHVLELQDLYQEVSAAQVAPSIVVDLGETRRVAYYTGPTFQILAEGPGQALASGGRYDALYSQFGVARPAAGGALHLDHLRWALQSRGHAPGGKKSPRVLVVESSSGSGEKLIDALRGAGIATVLNQGNTNILSYAHAWRFSHIVRVNEAGSECRLSRLEPAVATEADIKVLSRELSLATYCQQTKSLNELVSEVLA